jgi:hypothetical protein
MNILKAINSIFGLSIFICFFGVFISLFTKPHFIINEHNFNTPAILFLFCLIGFFVTFALKPILKEESGLKTQYDSGFSFWVVIVFLLTFITGIGYFIIYIPLNSIYFTEFNFQNTQSVNINAKQNMQIYLEIDADSYTINGNQIRIDLISNNFSTTSTITIGKIPTSDHKISTSTNKIVFIKDLIPSDGEYTLKITEIDDKTYITNIRVYGKINN